MVRRVKIAHSVGQYSLWLTICGKLFMYDGVTEMLAFSDSRVPLPKGLMLLECKWSDLNILIDKR
jgi:hypothetical protein